MSRFLITSVVSGADAEYPEAGGMKVHHFVDMGIRILEGFDWQKDGKALMARIQKAAELNEEARDV